MTKAMSIITGMALAAALMVAAPIAAGSAELTDTPVQPVAVAATADAPVPLVAQSMAA